MRCPVRRKYFPFICSMVVALGLTAGIAPQNAIAQGLPGVGEQPKAAVAEPEKKTDLRLAKMLKSPRATMATFLNAMHDGDFELAANCLDLSNLGETVAADKRKTQVIQLKEVLDRMLWIDPNTFAMKADPLRPYSIAEEDHYLTGDDLQDAKLIVLTESDDGLWRFSSKTLDALDSGLWLRWHTREPLVPQSKAEVEQQELAKQNLPFSLWLPTLFPESLTKQHFWIPDYQWACLLALIFVGFLADMITRFLLRHVTRLWFHYKQTGQELKKVGNPWKPVGLLVQANVWYFGTRAIGFPASMMTILLIGLKLFAVVAACWTAFLFINLLSNYLQQKAQQTETKFDDLLVPLVSRSLKALVLCMGAITGAKAFNLPINGLVGGLGLGGAALALASKDAISNLFGSLTVLTDRPFEVGDWVITDQAEGSVESVGFRSTRIRTFYNSQITVPNSLLTTAMVDNMGRRSYRRIKTILGIQYDTSPEQLDAFCEGIRELIRRHPHTRKDYYHVYFNQFGASSLDIMLYCFLDCPDWSIELRERHRLFLDILRLAQSLEVQFAFPTSTLHLFSEEASAASPIREDPLTAGRRAAATIAGPLPPTNQKPGAVEFPGPFNSGEQSESCLGEDDSV